MFVNNRIKFILLEFLWRRFLANAAQSYQIEGEQFVAMELRNKDDTKNSFHLITGDKVYTIKACLKSNICSARKIQNFQDIATSCSEQSLG